MESTLCCNENKNAIELERKHETKLNIKGGGGSNTNLQNKTKRSHLVIQRPMSIQFRVGMT